MKIVERIDRQVKEVIELVKELEVEKSYRGIEVWNASKNSRTNRKRTFSKK